jgi:DNA invertase Pin-like site-specific DNA recombinase
MEFWCSPSFFTNQLAALKAAGAETVYREKISGARADRTILAAFAEFERDLIRERTGEGRTRAKAAGVKFGRKLKLSPFQMAEAVKRRLAGESLVVIAKSYAVSISMISRL